MEGTAGEEDAGAAPVRTSYYVNLRLADNSTLIVNAKLLARHSPMFRALTGSDASAGWRELADGECTIMIRASNEVLGVFGF